MENVQFSPGGVPLVRAGPRVRGLGNVEADLPRMDCVVSHFERWVGKATQVFHEPRSELVHLDVHAIPARADYPFLTLFTTGMSQRPMPAAPTCGHVVRRLELMMTLPSSWELPPPTCRCHAGAEPAQKRRRRGPGLVDRTWPVRELLAVARYVHERASFVGSGHTLPNGDPPRRYGRGTRFCCTLVLPSVIAPPQIQRVVGPDREEIEILALWPLYREEVDLKLNVGHDALLNRLERFGITELVDVRRVNAATARRT